MITIVVYFGKDPWDGPRSLKEMLDLQGMPEKIQKLVADYPLYLLEVRKIKNPEVFQSDFRWVIEFLQKENNKEEIKKYLAENEKVFSRLDEEAYDLISVMTNSKELKKIKKECQTEEGAVDMCRAIKEIRNEGIELGRSEGIELGENLVIEVMKMNQKGLSVKEIALKNGISQEKVKRILEKLAA